MTIAFPAIESSSKRPKQHKFTLSSSNLRSTLFFFFLLDLFLLLTYFFLVFRCVCFTLPFNLQNVWTIPKPSVAGSPGIGDRQLMASCRLEKRKEGGLKHRGTKANSRVVSDVSRDKRKKKRKTKKWQATLITGCSYDTRNIKEKKKKGTRQE